LSSSTLDAVNIRLLAVAIFALNLCDAIFTIVHIERGASELNPLTDYLLSFGNPVFLLVKGTIVIPFLWLLVDRQSKGILIPFVGYVAINGWHLWLFVAPTY
jgi:hypothetical protein